ncbi:MAG: YfiR family protein [Candidatus Riflebacteria bacterium]|nr:YfiR family protein [Candidatus Riflebacteria bacterium]
MNRATGRPAAGPDGPTLGRRRFHVGAIVVALVAIAPVSTALAQDAETREYTIKAGFVFNFLRFSRFPAHATLGDTLTVAVLGSDPFGSTLDAIRGKEVQGKRIAVRRFKSLAEVTSCHLLFVGSSELPRLKSIFAVTEKQGILTVGETEGFAHAGGVFGLKTVDKRIRFEVNRDAARLVHVELSSQLLQVAAAVIDGRR